MVPIWCITYGWCILYFWQSGVSWSSYICIKKLFSTMFTLDLLMYMYDFNFLIRLINKTPRPSSWRVVDLNWAWCIRRIVYNMLQCILPDANTKEFFRQFLFTVYGLVCTTRVSYSIRRARRTRRKIISFVSVPSMRTEVERCYSRVS